ncbi:BatD family protein [Ichthyobacterium seriolicida]|uniref:Protein BatD n=1 Tax=Ichthyobacterium seriolicida TaxID=242600 RepID=A0A1J1DYE6_9FLAO|nr:BatD family protein [Ichthyobacterium seriolicida]BAV94922.1 hypothetical protein JBKA6_0909 [Ichthyobacterium seriolicida]
MRYLVRLLFVATFFISAKVFAQSQAEIKAVLDTNKIQIGEQIKFDLSISTELGKESVFPIIKDSIGPFEIVDSSEMDSLVIDERIIKKQSFVITKFDTGQYVLPPLKFEIEDDIKFSKPTMVDVISPELDIDNGQVKLRENRDIIDEPYTFIEILPYVLLGIIIIFIVYLIIRYMMKNREVKPKIVIKKPAHIIALERLKELDEKKLLTEGLFKQYYSELTDILRIFFEERFFFSAMELTSYEIISYFDKSGIHEGVISKDYLETLRELLSISDLVKFARAISTHDQAEKFRVYVEELIVETKFIEAENER